MVLPSFPLVVGIALLAVVCGVAQPPDRPPASPKLARQFGTAEPPMADDPLAADLIERAARKGLETQLDDLVDRLASISELLTLNTGDFARFPGVVTSDPRTV